MLDGLITSDVALVQIVQGLFGIVVAILTIVIALLKAKTVIYSKLILPIINICEAKSKKREDERIKRVFLELEPMIEARIEETLEKYEDMLHDQQITLRGSISESVEFKTFVTTSMLSLQFSIEKLVTAVNRNSEDAEQIQHCLKHIDDKVCPAFNKNDNTCTKG